VHRMIFDDSSVFQDMFSIPQPPGAPVDGSSMERPLRLEGVHRNDFRNFMQLFLPMLVLTSVLLRLLY
jgi:hypothetical protein